MATSEGVTTVERRVDYSETDQMGVVYHARYLVWLDVARTEYLRASGLSYRDLEAEGYLLVVSDLSVRYRRPARYDDRVSIRTWVSERASRRITFEYEVLNAETTEIMLTATTSLIVLDRTFRPTRLPDSVAALLHPLSNSAAR